MQKVYAQIICVIFFAAIAMHVCFAEQNKPEWVTPDIESYIDNVLAYEPQSGIVIGMIDDTNISFYCRGTMSQHNNQPIDENTLFEIGSATKVFTALLVMQMIDKGEMSLDDPLQKYVPEAVTVPTRNGKKIKLQNLLAHTSGLPYEVTNFHPKDLSNPYVDYTISDMYSFLSGYELPRDIGSQYEYSNVGYGLLEQSVVLKTGMSFDQLIREKITDELDMKSTMVSVPDDLSGRFVKGYSYGAETSHWGFASLAGAGALKSTAADLCRFLQAHMGSIPCLFFKTMKEMQEPQAVTSLENVDIALGWHIYNAGKEKIFFHTGGTGGFSSFIGFDPQTKKGVVILKNHPFDVQALGYHLINKNIPLSEMKSPLSLDKAILEKYAGIYQVSPQYSLTVKLRNDRLVIVQQGVEYDFELFAQTPTRFYSPLSNYYIEFYPDADGTVRRLLWIMPGYEIKAAKIK